MKNSKYLPLYLIIIVKKQSPICLTSKISDVALLKEAESALTPKLPTNLPYPFFSLTTPSGSPTTSIRASPARRVACPWLLETLPWQPTHGRGRESLQAGGRGEGVGMREGGRGRGSLGGRAGRGDVARW